VKQRVAGSGGRVLQRQQIPVAITAGITHVVEEDEEKGSVFEATRSRRPMASCARVTG
jgi:hypothetical protein